MTSTLDESEQQQPSKDQDAVPSSQHYHFMNNELNDNSDQEFEAKIQPKNINNMDAPSDSERINSRYRDSMASFRPDSQSEENLAKKID